jgi:hypothetical protein
MKRASVAQAKRLSRLGGWSEFKHKLMDYLNVPQYQFDKWDIPVEWQEAFCKANGRTFKSKER